MSIENTDIIITAFSVAGPKPTEPVRPKNATDEQKAAYEAQLIAYDEALNAWDQRVKAAAREIKVATAPESRIFKQLESLDKAIRGTEGKVFTGTVVKVTKESSSQRGVVTLYTGTETTIPGLPAGCEQVRTERTDNADGRAIARQAQLLIGHRVTVYVELESIRNGAQKVRVLRHVASNGKDDKVPEEVTQALAA